MNTNYHFTHKEDAEHFQRNEGGRLHDNRHSAHEWKDNQFTVSIQPKKVLQACDGTVYFTKEEFEEWMEEKGWSEEIKQYHREEFTGEIEFTNNGNSFEHI